MQKPGEHTSDIHEELGASRYFGERVAAYDSLIARAVPRYAEMTERLVEYLPRTASRVLELGCGTGNLSLELAERYPLAELTLVDAAPEMIEVTRARLEVRHPGTARRARFLVARFEELALAPASFDLATSCISLHHVRDKLALYQKLHAVLAPGGRLLFADQLRGGTDENHALNWMRWLEFCRMPGHCDESEVQSLLDHAAAHDHYTALAEHFRLLEQAGFRDLDCVWRNWMWAILTARASKAGI